MHVNVPTAKKGIRRGELSEKAPTKGATSSMIAIAAASVKATVASSPPRSWVIHNGKNRPMMPTKNSVFPTS